MKKWFFVVLLAGLRPVAAQTCFELIPRPRSVEVLGPELFGADSLRTEVRCDAPAEWDDERYSLLVGPRGVQIRAKTAQGVVWARRTLEQLRDDEGRYPHVRIDDWPEFPVRGFLYDDGRNFAGVARIKHYLDLLSAYKANVFQWHLTDKPAWRIESRRYPCLNDGRYQRPGRDTGRYYTYDEIREVIDYARERGIRVVPEIDMPGHSDYFDAAFGFPMASEESMAVLEGCLEEFFAEIPAESCPLIHIGSDEVLIPEPGRFMRWAQEFVRSHGRTPVVWDPGLPSDSLTIRQIWRDGGAGDAAVPSGVRFIDSWMGYLNYYDPLLFPAKLYFHTPCAGGRRSDEALGGILCMWNDVRVADKSLTEQHNGMAGGLLVFAERFWNGGRTVAEPQGTLLPAPDSEAMRGFEELQQRMAVHKRRFLEREMSYWESLHASEWEVTFVADSVERSVVAWGDVLDLDALCRRCGIPEGLPVLCRAVRRIESPCDTVRLFKVGFEAPARSNRISDGIAQQGCWPNDGRVTIDGRELPPPHWNEPGAYRFHFNTWARPEEEHPFTDEQLYWMRRPLPVALHEGTNRIEMTVRRHFVGQRFHLSFVEVAPR